ncbi:N-acetylmuramoyl-L-alanine amidase [Citricoccus sp. K5]|uniref:peptidoglycan recognition protein family protein n=1 Tax=Citricoccus sp. K5 TaxID=2653135 RepID=UPI0012F0E32D|nr:N-acetylmuramoyl-L-alanine amidase [Citricoccus sp. K5]VXB22107.1 hypothetical protein CITRIK5_20638 [Citricoccus sp. K5]
MFLTGLARVARDAGITVREVPGWKTRTAHKGGMNKVHGVIWHHTATSASAVKSKNNPTLNYMVSGLGYPLANYGLAWDGSLDVIAAGTGAHAGVGSYKGIPNNDGNRHLIGVEVEGTIGLEWSPAQLETAARLGAQLNKDFGSGLLHIAHYEWAPGRKTDPTGIPGNMTALRAAIKRGNWAAVINPAASEPAKPSTPKEEDIMTPDQEAKLDRAIALISETDKNNQARANVIPAQVWEHKIGTGSRAQDYLYGARMAQYAARDMTRQAIAGVQAIADTPGVTIEEVRDALAKVIVTVDVKTNGQEN